MKSLDKSVQIQNLNSLHVKDISGSLPDFGRVFTDLKHGFSDRKERRHSIHSPVRPSGRWLLLPSTELSYCFIYFCLTSCAVGMSVTLSNSDKMPLRTLEAPPTAPANGFIATLCFGVKSVVWSSVDLFWVAECSCAWIIMSICLQAVCSHDYLMWTRCLFERPDVASLRVNVYF